MVDDELPIQETPSLRLPCTGGLHPCGPGERALKDSCLAAYVDFMAKHGMPPAGLA